MSLLGKLATALNARRPGHDGGRAPSARVSRPAAEGPNDEGYESLFITAPDDLRLHVRVYGARTTSAPPVVCLPGLARTTADFESLATALTAEPSRPRQVVALDYRGHGRSQYDSNPRNYGLRRDLADLTAVLTALGIASAVFAGTSHGGILALMLARARPALFAGAILNDIGPVIDPRAVLQMKGYIGKLPVPRDFAEGAEILHQLFGPRFSRLTPREWVIFAKRTWRAEPSGALVLDHDPRVVRALDGNLEHSPATLWEAFDALAGVPVMVVRGSTSTMLSAHTLDQMMARRGALSVAVVPDQGHPPMLDDPKLLQRIATFVASCDGPAMQIDASDAPAGIANVQEQKIAV